jgi:tRNA modification GTPase
VFGGDRDLDTICAISTPLGFGGVSVIRISGSSALFISLQACKFLPAQPTPHHIYFGNFKDLNSESVDEVLVSYFADKRSFTGEETLEISCHGSPYIAEKILSVLVSHGARIADRGEFTYRAFLNGKIDLVQAESVIDLVHSQSSRSAKQALSQLKGGLSSRLQTLEDKMTYVMAQLEASIDFSTEDIEIVSYDELVKELEFIIAELKGLIKSYDSGKILREGFTVVIAGQPNVGKSSIFNRVVGEEKAIVTEVAGTTRDLLDGRVVVEGVLVNFVDTAGIRLSTDRVEQIGIHRAIEATKNADLIFYVYDLSVGLQAHDIEQLQTFDLANLVFIGNKNDLVNLTNEVAKQDLLKAVKPLKSFQNFNQDGFINEAKLVLTSALDIHCSDQIIGTVRARIRSHSIEDQSAVSNARHFENLQNALAASERACELARSCASYEFLSLELKVALIAVQETLGKRFDDEVMDRVFKEFCIGK